MKNTKKKNVWMFHYINFYDISFLLIRVNMNYICIACLIKEKKMDLETEHRIFQMFTDVEVFFVYCLKSISSLLL